MFVVMGLSNCRSSVRLALVEVFKRQGCAFMAPDFVRLFSSTCLLLILGEYRFTLCLLDCALVGKCKGNARKKGWGLECCRSCDDSSLIGQTQLFGLTSNDELTGLES